MLWFPAGAVSGGLGGEVIINSQPSRGRQCSNSPTRVLLVRSSDKLNLNPHPAATRLNKEEWDSVSYHEASPLVFSVSGRQWRPEPVYHLASLRLNKVMQLGLIRTPPPTTPMSARLSGELNLYTHWKNQDWLRQGKAGPALCAPSPRAYVSGTQ